MKKLAAGLMLLALRAAPALAQASEPEPQVAMVWVWVFVVLFFGSIVVVGWMMWRSEKADREEKLKAAQGKGPDPATTAAPKG